MDSGVYGIICEATGRIYIGSTNDFRRRKNEHFNKLRNGKHINEKLQKDFTKFGESYFKFLHLWFCTEDKLIEAEKSFLSDKSISLYNITTAEEDLSKFICSEETKRKIGNANSNSRKWNSGKTNVYKKETLEKMSKAKWNLTHEQLFQIKELILANKTLTEISKLYNVSVATISKIKNGHKTYSSILDGGVNEWKGKMKNE